MLTKINRGKCLAKYPNFPRFVYDEATDEYEPFYPDPFRHYILTLPAKTLDEHVHVLGRSLVNLVELMGHEHLVFLGDSEPGWRSQNNDYEPVQEALHYLAANAVGKRFNGALQVNRNELPVFVKHLFWLTRCNASLPYFYFSDPDQSVMGTICKYGNIHISVLSESTDQLLDEVVEHTEFIYLPSGSDCDNLFDETNAIEGRQIVI